MGMMARWFVATADEAKRLVEQKSQVLFDPFERKSVVRGGPVVDTEFAESLPGFEEEWLLQGEELFGPDVRAEVLTPIEVEPSVVRIPTEAVRAFAVRTAGTPDIDALVSEWRETLRARGRLNRYTEWYGPDQVKAFIDLARQAEATHATIYGMIFP